MQSSRGFGELGSTKRDKNTTSKAQLLKQEGEDSSERDDEENYGEEDEDITCPNCSLLIPVQEAAAHTV